ncbi:DUF4097 family beta strand repeat-containing protein [Nonomuraea soli]|uniref:DUF4097 and DUF4098 domain-containing protein YvlB n=1 Tax=Nonomuraea soli TaxID=1032476 RepID=A0A7W0CE75_9ACTN|nr:DUF4097 family beta strand repeat-containing protein [Nonomuraea soli]MBA2889501.1 DUF4097 and DUF4098 domain-containing protein YvlB [Nonomuraea soli]
MTEFPTPKPITLHVDVPAGRVDITASDRPTTEVEVKAARFTDESYAEQVRVEQNGDTVSIVAPHERRGLRSSSLRVTVSLPTGSRLDVTTASADVTVTGHVADVMLGTASGDVKVESADSVRIKTASGDVRCDVIAGQATVTTASGDIVLRSVGGAAEVGTASGDITLTDVGGDLLAKSASGDLSFGAVRGGRAEVRSTSGDVRLAVPEGTAAWLDVSSLSGDISSSLHQGEQPSEGERTMEVSVRTLSGDISIVRTR